MHVIDVHCHLFTAQDIPVQGFLRARGVPDRVTPRIEHAIHQLSSEAKTAEGSAGEKNSDKFLQIIQNRNPSMVIPANYAAWIRILTLSSNQLADRMLTNYPDTRLFVPLMVDLEYWLEGPVERSFPEQLAVIAATIDRYPGRIHPFVAFSPERARRRSAPPDRVFAIIREALFNQGFIGVKLYPPLGFRPAGNQQRKPVALHAKAYDDLLAMLYEFCEKNEVPITAHCTNRGVKAGPGQGGLAHPGYWEQILERHPDLHLNLAHFGGDRHLSRLGRRSWTWTIARLMDRFDHVYTDTAYHKKVYRERSREKLFAGLERVCDRTPKMIDRLMFGTDWHILATKRDSATYTDIYREQYRQRFGDEATRALFAGNAEKFLGLLPGGKNRQRLQQFYTRKNRQQPAWLV